MNVCGVHGWYSSSTECVLCCLTLIKDCSQAMVKRKHYLQNILTDIHSNQQVAHLIKSSPPLLSNATQVFLNIIREGDRQLAELSCQGISALLKLSENPQLLKSLLNAISLSFCQGEYGYVQLLYSLCANIPGLSETVIHNYSSLLAAVVDHFDSYGLTTERYGDVILLFLSAKLEWPQPLYLSLVRQVIDCLSTSTNPAVAKTLLEICRVLCQECKTCELMLNIPGRNFLIIIKRYLINKDQTLQLLGVRCISSMMSAMSRDSSLNWAARIVLDADMSEIMFELLQTSNDVIAKEALDSLMYLSTLEGFYSDGHVLYGIDLLLRSHFHITSQELLNKALLILNNIFSRKLQSLCAISSGTALENAVKMVVSCVRNCETFDSSLMFATTLLSAYNNQDVASISLLVEAVQNSLSSHQINIKRTIYLAALARNSLSDDTNVVS